MKKVSKAEYLQFIEKYPRKLERDVYGVFEPPLVTYNDFTLGKWPISIVAKERLYSDEPGDYFYKPESERDYCIAPEATEPPPHGDNIP